MSWRTALVLLGGIFCISTAAILIRLADAPALVVATYRMVFAALLVVGPTLLIDRGGLAAARRHDRRPILLAGLALAVHFALWISSLAFTSVANSVILVATSPLFVGLAAPFVLGERVPRRITVGILTAFLGGALIAHGDLATGQRALLGDLLALGGAVAAAAYLLAGRQVRPHLRLLPYVTLVYGVAAVTLVALAAGAGLPLTGYSATTWILLLLLAAGPQVLGHSSLNWALNRLPATLVAATVLAEPLCSTLLAWWILAERPPASTLWGGSFILAGLAVALRPPGRGRSRRARLA